MQVFTEDQFGERTLTVIGARVLLVPTQKLVGGLGFPDELNRSSATRSRRLTVV